MDVAIAKMSSKGQIVIPAEMREQMHEGDKIMVIKNDNQIILKRASEADENFSEDVEFAKRTEEALKRYKRGGFKEKSRGDFLKEMARW